MKTRIFLFLALFQFNSFSQSAGDNSVHARFGIYELTVGHERKIDGYFGFGIEADYRPAFSDAARHNIQWLNMGTAFSAFRTRALLNFYMRDSFHHVTIAPSVRYLFSNVLQYDPGGFSGSNSSYYAEYAQTGFEYGINLMYHRSLYSAPAISWYIGIGGFAQNVERNYIAEGTFWQHFPSDKVENVRYFYPGLMLGLKFRIVQWGPTKEVVE